MAEIIDQGLSVFFYDTQLWWMEKVDQHFNIFFANKQAFQNNFLKDQTQTILILVRPRYEFNKSKHHLHRRSGYSTE